MIINKNFLSVFILVPLMATCMEQTHSSPRKMTAITEKDISFVNKFEVNRGDDVGVMYEALLSNGDLLSATKFSSGKVICQRTTENSGGPINDPCRSYFSMLERVFEERNNHR